MQVRPKKTKKKILITITVILSSLAVGGFVAYLYVTWPNGSSTDPNSSQTEAKRPTDTDQTTNPTPNTNSDSQEQTTVDGKTPVQYEGQTTETTPSTDNEQFRIPEGQ